MPGQEKKTSVLAVVLSGPKVKTGGRDVTISKFSVDVPESWNEKDISSVLNTAADVPRGVWLEILWSNDGGKTVGPFKTSRAKPLDGKMIASEKIKTLYLRPSKSLVETPGSPGSDKKSNSSTKNTAKSPAKTPKQATNASRGRGRPAKSQSPDKKEKVDGKVGERTASESVQSETKRSKSESKPTKDESKAKNEAEGSKSESRSSRAESRSSRGESQAETKREVSKSPSRKEGAKERPGRSPVKSQAVPKSNKEAVAKQVKSPSKPDASPAKPSERSSRSAKSPSVPIKSPGRPARSANKPAESPAANPAANSRGRGRPAKKPAMPESPKKPSESPEKPARVSRNQTKSPAPSRSPAARSPAATAKSPGRPPKIANKAEEDSPEKPTRGRGRPAKTEQPAPAVKSPAQPKESTRKVEDSPRKESRGRGRPASVKAEDKPAESPKKSEREQSGAKSPAATSRSKVKEESSPVNSPARSTEISKEIDAKQNDVSADANEKKGRGRPPSKRAESTDKKEGETETQPRKRGRPRLDESENKKERKDSESASPVKSPKKGDRNPSKSSKRVDIVETQTEKRQRRAPKKFEDYDSDYQIETDAKKQTEKTATKESPKAQEKKEVPIKKATAVKKAAVQEEKAEDKEEGEVEAPKDQETPQEVAKVVVMAGISPRKRRASMSAASADELSTEKQSPKAKKSSHGMLKVKMAFKGRDKEPEGKKRAQSLSPVPKVVPTPEERGDRPKSLSPPRGKILYLPSKSGNLESPVRKVYVPSFSDLMTGRKDIEPRNRPVTCLDCGEIVANRDQLYHHKAKCASIGMHRVYACQDCPSSYYSRTDLVSHRRREHFKNPGSHMIERYGDKPDGEMGMGNWDVSGHTVKALVSGSNGKDYNICICMACRAVFVNNENLEAHMRETHPELLVDGASANAGLADAAQSDPAINDDQEENETSQNDGDESETDDAQGEAGSSRRRDDPVKKDAKANAPSAKKSESPRKKNKELPAEKVATSSPTPANKAEASPARKAEESPSKRSTRGRSSSQSSSQSSQDLTREPEKEKEEPQKAAKAPEKKSVKEAVQKNPPKVKSISVQPKSPEPSQMDDASSRRSARKRKPSQWMKDYVESEEDVQKPKSEEASVTREVQRGRPRKKSLLVLSGETPEQVVKSVLLKARVPAKKRRGDEEELGFLCEECDTGCRSAKELEMHIMDVHRIQCQCGKKFMYRADLECHKIVTCSAATWHCFECDHNFESRQAYNDHKDSCSSGLYRCSNCGMQSQNAKDHNKHRTACNSRVMCKICNLYFLNREVLLTHMEKRHMLNDDKSKKAANKELEESGAVIGTVTVVSEETEEPRTLSRRSARSKGQKSPQKGEMPLQNTSEKDKPIVSKEETAVKPETTKSSPKTPVKQTIIKPATPSTSKVHKEVRFETPEPDVSDTPAIASTSMGTPKTPAETKPANKNVSFIVSASQLNELMSGGQEKLMKFLNTQMKQPQGDTPKPAEVKTAVRQQAPVVVVSAKTPGAKGAPVVQSTPKASTSAKVPTAAAKTPDAGQAQEKSATPAGQDSSKMSFVVTASQLKELMKGGKDSLKSFVSTQMRSAIPVKMQQQTATPTPVAKQVAKPKPESPPVASTPKPPASPKKLLAPEHDPRLRRAIPLSPPKPKVPSPPPKTVVEPTPIVQQDIEETVNIPVGNSCINIPMSIIQNHIQEANPEGTTKQLVVTTSEGVPYSVFVNANEDGSNIQIRLEKIEDEESLLALQGLQAPTPPSPPKPSKTIQVVTVSQPETQEVTVMPPHQAGAISPPSILRKRRLSEELVESAATASTMPKVPRLGNLGQYKIHCKDCQMLFDNYSLFTRHACVQKAQEKKRSPTSVAERPTVIQPAVSQPTSEQQPPTLTQGKPATQTKKRTYFECSCCHQVFSSMLLFNRHVCNTENSDGTQWKVQSLGSRGTKTENSDVEWLIAEAGSN